MNDEQAARIFNLLVTAWPDKELPDETIDLWIEMIDDLDYADAQAAAKDIVRHDQWFPTVARFRQQCEVHASRRRHKAAADRGLPQGGFVQPPQALLNATRQMLAERAKLPKHWHGGPGPCPVCGGTPRNGQVSPHARLRPQEPA